MGRQDSTDKILTALIKFAKISKIKIMSEIGCKYLYQNCLIIISAAT